MKGQLSIELIVIIGLVMVIFIPLLVTVYYKSNEANEEIALHQAELSVSRLAYLANSIGSLGTKTTIYTDVYVPKNVMRINITQVNNGGEITFIMNNGNSKTNEISSIVKHKISKNQTITPNTGGWMRFQISSDWQGSENVMTIERVT